MSAKKTEITKLVKNNVAQDISVGEFIDEVIEGVQRLRLGKSDGDDGLNSDEIGSKILFVLLAVIFNSILVHGFRPDSILV